MNIFHYITVRALIGFCRFLSNNTYDAKLYQVGKSQKNETADLLVGSGESSGKKYPHNGRARLYAQHSLQPSCLQKWTICIVLSSIFFDVRIYGYRLTDDLGKILGGKRSGIELWRKTIRTVFCGIVG